jgi:hypothetical protein
VLYAFVARILIPLDPTGNPEFDATQGTESVFVGIVVISAAVLTGFLEARRSLKSEATKDS